jgi:hypothetical protein
MNDGIEPLWLQLARADLGVSEVVGPKASPVIKGYFRDAGHPEIAQGSPSRHGHQASWR